MSEDPAGNDFSSDSHPKPVDGGGSSSGGGRKHRTRLERAERLAAAAAQLAQGQPLRQVATGLGVARRTLRDWCAAEPFAGLPPEVATCLATPAGVCWLHRLVVVMHLITTLRAGAGVRLVCEFLELSGLSAVVGASYGSQYAVTVQVQDAVAQQAQAQRSALATGMPPRAVTVCEDETFHPDVCLVAIEPVSNFILVEQYAPDRTAATWTPALNTALDEWPVTVIQGTRDEAKAWRPPVQKASAPSLPQTSSMASMRCRKRPVYTWPARSNRPRPSSRRPRRHWRPHGPPRARITRRFPIRAADPRP